MKISKNVKNLVIIYANLAAILVTVGAFTYTTMAWFVTERAKSVHMASVEVEAPGFTVQNFECYGVTALTKGSTSTSLTFVNEQIFVLPSYDSRDISYSYYLKAIVVHVSFTYSEAAAVTFSAKTSNDLFSTGTTGSGLEDDNFTSNVFQITMSSGTTLTSGWSSASLSYTNADTKSFVTVGTPPSKTMSVVVGGISPGAGSFWFVIEYNLAVMQYIENARLSNGRPVVYHDDITYQVAA